MTVFFTNPLIVHIVVSAWEFETTAMDDIEEPFDVAIVLGGFSRVIPAISDRLHLTDHPNRLVNAIELYHSGKIDKILVSGGSPKVIGSKPTDEEPVRRFLLAAGLPPEDILMEAQSRNTHENAVFSADLLAQEIPDARCLLVTSAFHMRRSLACFQAVGIEATPFATDILAYPIEHLTPNELLVPDPSGFETWGLLIKEWVGFVVYKMKGYT